MSPEQQVTHSEAIFFISKVRICQNVVRYQPGAMSVTCHFAPITVGSPIRYGIPISRHILRKVYGGDIEGEENRWKIIYRLLF